MTPTALRPQVLSLYRRLMRLGRNWEASNPLNTQTEKDYILGECRRLFRENRWITSKAEVSEHIREAEARATMAEHYQNPYPRPVNLPLRSYTKKEGQKVGKAVQKINEFSKPIYIKSIYQEDVASRKK